MILFLKTQIALRFKDKTGLFKANGPFKCLSPRIIQTDYPGWILNVLSPADTTIAYQRSHFLPEGYESEVALEEAAPVEDGGREEEVPQEPYLAATD